MCVCVCLCLYVYFLLKNCIRLGLMQSAMYSKSLFDIFILGIYWFADLKYLNCVLIVHYLSKKKLCSNCWLWLMLVKRCFVFLKYARIGSFMFGGDMVLEFYWWNILTLWLVYTIKKRISIMVIVYNLANPRNLDGCIYWLLVLFSILILTIVLTFKASISCLY